MNDTEFHLVKKKEFKKMPIYGTRTKEMLCRNILNDGICKYKHKCLYAHSLDEQVVSDLRRRAYQIILESDDLSELDLTKDKELYFELIQLTKVCERCVRNECTGGKNCRNGVCKRNYRLCYNDLVFGECSDINCKSIHLSERGYISYVKRTYNKIIKQKEEDSDTIKNLYKTGIEVNNDYFDEEDTRDISIFEIG